MEQTATVSKVMDFGSFHPKFEGMFGKQFLNFLTSNAERFAHNEVEWITEKRIQHYLPSLSGCTIEVYERDFWLYIPVNMQSEKEYHHRIPVEYSYFAYAPYREAFVLHMNSLLGKQGTVIDENGSWMVTWKF